MAAKYTVGEDGSTVGSAVSKTKNSKKKRKGALGVSEDGSGTDHSNVPSAVVTGVDAAVSPTQTKASHTSKHESHEMEGAQQSQVGARTAATLATATPPVKKQKSSDGETKVSKKRDAGGSVAGSDMAAGEQIKLGRKRKDRGDSASHSATIVTEETSHPPKPTWKISQVRMDDELPSCCSICFRK